MNITYKNRLLLSQNAEKFPRFGAHQPIDLPFLHAEPQGQQQKVLNLEQKPLYQRLTHLFRPFFKRHQLHQHHKRVMALDKTSENYIQTLIGLANSIVGKTMVEVNTEEGALQKLTHAQEPYLFILNHNLHFQKQDTAMLAMFLMLLYGDYLNQGKGATCPRLTILVNQDIFHNQGKQVQEILTKMGVVGVDASLNRTQETISTNQAPLRSVVKTFLQSKNHLFIFPEGRRILFDLLPAHQKMPDVEKAMEKFQSGVAEMVRIITQRKGTVKVVPLGLGVSEKSHEKNLTSLFIGEPVVFEKHGKQITCNAANINAETSPRFAPLFQNQQWRPFKEQGKDLTAAIGGMLCENLRICKENALKQLPEPASVDITDALLPIFPTQID